MKKDAIQLNQIAQSIHLLRGEKVMLDSDLAALYGVTTGNLNKAVQRNRARFPEDFMFRLSAEEMENLRFQSGISRWGGRRTRSFAFTEQGVAMLSMETRVGKHDDEIAAIIEAIRQLIAPAKGTAREIGFHVRETAPRYGTRKRS